MTHDDPRLTAYALNELDEVDRPELEAFIAEDERAKRIVEETRRTVAMLTEGLKCVELPTLTPVQKDSIAVVSAPVLVSTYPRSARRRPAWAKWALATAACAALVAGGWAALLRIESEAPVVALNPSSHPQAVADTIAQLTNQSQEQIQKRHYKQALGILTQILELDPKNDYARAVYALAFDAYQHQPNQNGYTGNTLDLSIQQSIQATSQSSASGTVTVKTGGKVLSPADNAALFNNSSFPSNFAFLDHEGATAKPISPQTKSVDSYVGNFGLAPLSGDSSGPTAGMRIQGTTGNTGPIVVTGVTVDPDIRSSLFTLPNVRESYVTANPSAGGKNVPYVDRFGSARNGTVQNGPSASPTYFADTADGTSGQQLSPADFSALVAHYRARGADGVHLLDGGVQGYTQAEFEQAAKNGLTLPNIAGIFQERTATAPNESYAAIHDNPFLPVANDPLSTFSIDVDTGSYSNIRRFLNDGHFPPPDAVRIEEMLNYFPYNYETPKSDSKVPFATTIEIAACPWNMSHRLARVAIKGREIAHDKRPVSNLVFLIDVSGSMNEPAKLPLVKEGLKLMVNELTENDRISVVVYAGNAGLVLNSTTADPKNKPAILNAIDNLSAGGSTNGGQGIELAYKLATDNFIKGGTNRVLLATDGDWNVGITDQSSLTQLIQDKAKSGVFLSVLGYGFGNLKDATMEKLADKGNGHYAYIDNLKESKKVLVEEMSSTLVTIAKDVKIQVEFNPSKVESYRLIGYEKRLLRKEDFNNDKVDAGEIGAGHAVTALYEIAPLGSGTKDASPETKPQPEDVDSLKYQKHEVVKSDDLMTVKLRYKQPDGEQSAKLEFPAIDKGLTYSKASEDFKFSAAVAQFGMILRNSPHKGTASLDGVLELAAEGKGKDEKGYRGEFLEMVTKAKALSK